MAGTSNHDHQAHKFIFELMALKSQLSRSGDEGFTQEILEFAEKLEKRYPAMHEKVIAWHVLVASTVPKSAEINDFDRTEDSVELFLRREADHRIHRPH